MDVGVRELKARLSTYLARARRGESIVVTSRGRPVARLEPVEQDAPPEELRAQIASGRLIYKGRLDVAILPPPIKLSGAGKTSTDYVREGRR